MYDKFGCVLRIESTCNDISTFRVEREVQHRDGTSDIRKAPLKKSIYSLYQLFTILKSANYRYLEFISSFDDHSSGRKKLDEVSHSRREKERTYCGFNFFDSRDLSVLEAISKGGIHDIRDTRKTDPPASSENHSVCHDKDFQTSESPWTD